jgi:hypothetical protein
MMDQVYVFAVWNDQVTLFLTYNTYLALSFLTANEGGPQPGAVGSGDSAFAVALGTPQPSDPALHIGGPHRPLPPFFGCG